MLDTKLSRVRDLFERVVAALPDQRPDLLDRECGDDRELRAELEEMLAADAQHSANA